MAAQGALAAGLKSRIQSKYEELGYSMGWRLLYSPERVLEIARTALVGQNPGGSYAPPDHAEFAMQSGSAYTDERWGAAPGQGKLQRQVLALLHLIGERPEDVLAGNLVPFRSPSWEALPKKDEALAFGRSIWREILRHAKPRLVIGMGLGTSVPILKELLGVRDIERLKIGWGNNEAERGVFDDGTFIGVPHLSRFPFTTREESQEALQRLLGEHYYCSAA
jgi:hypothetical protein